MSDRPTLAEVRRDGDDVWIENVDRLPLRESGADRCQYMAALTAVAHALGSDIIHEELMGLSGAAFRFLFHHPGWCPSSVGRGSDFFVERGLEILGCKTELVNGDKEDPEVAERYRQIVTASIGRGRPVLMRNCGLIVGYSDSGSVLLVRHCHLYAKDGDRVELRNLRDEGLRVVMETGDAPPRRASILASLRFAVEHARTERWEDQDYLCGLAAYEAWLGDLEDEGRLRTQLDRGVQFIREVNCYIYRTGLVPLRLAAGSYLRLIGDEHDGDAAKHLGNAAELYDRIGEALLDGQQFVPGRGSPQWELPDWPDELRLGQIAALEEALDLERNGISEIEKALASVEDGER